MMPVWLVLAALLYVCALGSAAVSPQTMLKAVKKAETLGATCSFAVNPVYAGSAVFGYEAPAAAASFMRMDNAPAATIDLSMARASAAFLFGALPQNATESSGELYNIQLTDAIFATGSSSSIMLLASGEAVGIACDVNTEKDSQKMDVIASAFVLQDKMFEYASEGTPSPASVITLQQAQSMIDAVTASSHERPVAIAVVDRSSRLKAMFIEPGCPLGYAGAAVSKARSAVMFDSLDGSEGLQSASLPGADAYGVQVTNGGLFSGVGGIAVTRVEGDSTQIYGAIAVAGSGFTTEDVSKDKELAKTGSAAVDVSTMDPITLRTRRGVTMHEAQVAVQRVFQARLQLNESSPGVVAVADAAGRLRAVYVEDGMERGALDIAIKSATTSALFKISSLDLGTFTQEGQPLYNIEYLMGGLVTFETAEPLYANDGSFIGAVGVSGTGAGKGTANDGYLAKVAADAVASYDDECATATGYCSTPVEPVVTVDLTYTSPYVGEVLSLSQAVGLIQSITDYNQKVPQSSCNTVYDASVRLRAMLCMDDAFVGATDLTGRKAKTAQLFRKVANDELQAAQQPGGLLYKIEVTNGGLFTNAGGASLFDAQGTVVGSVGVAGAAVTGDGEVVGVATATWVPPSAYQC